MPLRRGINIDPGADMRFERTTRTQYARMVLSIRENPTDEHVRLVWKAATVVWDSYDTYGRRADTPDYRRFKSLVNRLAPTRRGCYVCQDCYLPTLSRTSIARVCRSCVDTNYTRCDRGDHWAHRRQLVDTPQGRMCEGCARVHMARCWNCSQFVDGEQTSDVNGRTICEDCHDNLPWCEHCEEYYLGDEQDHPCYRNCRCEPAMPAFRFPSDGGSSTIGSGERHTIALPTGTVSEAGMAEIAYAVYSAVMAGWENRPWIPAARAAQKIAQAANYSIMEMEPLWTTKNGNMTKRISKMLYQAHGFKAEPELITRIGNIARQYSGKHSQYHLEVSRDLNEGPEHWYHEDSCWWGSYAQSRCTFKGAAGLGMRIFSGADSGLHGRVWIIPLDAEMHASQDPTQARALIAFNAYGEIDGFDAARVLASMTGWSYRKVGFDVDEHVMYVNQGRKGSAGYLVAPQDICDVTETVSMRTISEAQHGLIARRVA